MGVIDILKSARKRVGMTQDEVGEAIGITGGAYSKIETGVNPVAMEYVKNLCDVLRIPYLTLLKELYPLHNGLSCDEYIRKGVCVGSDIVFSDEEYAILKFLSDYTGVSENHPDLVFIMSEISRMRKKGIIISNMLRGCRS